MVSNTIYASFFIVKFILRENAMECIQCMCVRIVCILFERFAVCMHAETNICSGKMEWTTEISWMECFRKPRAHYKMTPFAMKSEVQKRDIWHSQKVITSFLCVQNRWWIEIKSNCEFSMRRNSKIIMSCPILQDVFHRVYSLYLAAHMASGNRDIWGAAK